MLIHKDQPQQISCRSMQINRRFHADPQSSTADFRQIHKVQQQISCRSTTAYFKQLYEDQPQISCRSMQISHSRFPADPWSSTADVMQIHPQQISCKSMQINHSRFHADLCRSTITADFRQIYGDQPQQISCRSMQINHNSRFQADLWRSATADFMQTPADLMQIHEEQKGRSK